MDSIPIVLWQDKPISFATTNSPVIAILLYKTTSAPSESSGGIRVIL